MMLRFHGRRVSLGECRERVPIGRDGTSARALAEAARSLGLAVKSYAPTPEAFARVDLPAIVHWEGVHFVVLERRSARTVDIVDPAFGRRRVTVAEFLGAATGPALVCTAGAAFMRDRSIVRRRPRRVREGPLRLAIKRSRRGLLALMGASLMLQLLALAVPAATAVAIDRVLPADEDRLLPLLLAGTAVLTLTHFAVARARAAALIRVRRRVDDDIVSALFGRLLKLPLGFFLERSSSDLIQRLSSTIVVRELVTTQTVTAILDGAFLLLYLGILFAKDMLFGVLALGVGLVDVLLVLGTHARTLRLHHRHLLAQVEADGLLIQAIEGIPTLKAMAAEDRLYAQWSKRFATALDIDAERNRLAATVDMGTASLRVLAPLAFLLLGAMRVIEGGLSLGSMLALQALAVMFLAPLSSLIAGAQKLESVGAHLDRLRDVFEADAEPTRPRTDSRRRLRGAIRLEHVSFRYHPASPFVLRHISLDIAPGSTVAIVGSSGCGKSTLAMLLLGLGTPAAGSIRYDGVDLQHLDLRHVRSQFGVVLQEPFLFRDSIRQNVAWGDDEMPLERIIAASRTAEIHDDIMSMPLKYETRVSEGGGGLSGGQRQRLAIARAVARRPSLLLLDEATSHLDAITEQRVAANLGDLDCTRVVIAHRLSTIRTADDIVVVDRGTIVEHGTHEELLARRGHYAALVGRQHEGTTADLAAA
jgi:ATP-binding cassette subfamily B protein